MVVGGSKHDGTHRAGRYFGAGSAASGVAILAASIIVLIAWGLFCWRVTEAYANGRVAVLVHQEKEEASRQADNLEGNVTRYLTALQAMLRMMVQGETLVSYLRAHQVGVKPVLQLLKTIQEANNAELVWVTGPDGRTMVVSDNRPDQGFAAIDFSDWDFFLQAKSGGIGKQFLTNPESGVTQLIFARGIVRDGHFLGTVAVKVNVATLGFLKEHINVFLTDRNGVIIAASDKKWEMHTVPGNAVASLADAHKFNLYRRNSFESLGLRPWSGHSIEPLHWIEDIDEPVVIASQRIQAMSEGYVYVMCRVAGLKNIDNQRYGFFYLMIAFGAAVILVMDGLLIYSIKARQTERLVREQKVQLDEAQRLARLGRWEMDLGTRRLRLSEEALRIFEVESGAEMAAASFLRYVHPEDRRKVMKAVARSIRHRSPYDLIYRLCCVDGCIKYVNGRGVCHYDAYDRPMRMVGTLQDVTERMEAESMKRQAEEQSRSEALAHEQLAEATRSNEELRDLNIKLKQAQSQLLQSEKMASVGLLAAGVAHEINNPVGFVLSNLNSLGEYMRDFLHLLEMYERLEAALPESKRDEVKDLKSKIDLPFLKEDVVSLLAESHNGIERVRKIVQNLKDFSRADTSDDWKLDDVHAGLESTLSVVWNELKYKCEVRKEYGKLPLIECRLPELNQVFMNLLVNASHAIEKKGVITIRTGVQDKEAWVEIADTGCGMKPEVVEHIFEPFFTTKPVGKGTGLGLSVSYNIVQKHHGRIEVESTPGVGTSFRVCLPLEQPRREESGATGAAPVVSMA
ncbi:MAG TPA: ATP-binding protein [Rhodocyclaceae bacterium]|nr:ATP-binding protein [Rhodocyclaceae bacterium]